MLAGAHVLAGVCWRMIACRHVCWRYSGIILYALETGYGPPHVLAYDCV